MLSNNALPANVTREINALLERMKEIGIELRCGPYHGDSVQIDGVFIKTKSCHYNIIKNTLDQINPKILGKYYRLIPKALLQTLNKDNSSCFDLALLTHNEVVNKYKIIPIKFLPNLFSNMKIGGATDGFPAQSIAVPFNKCLVDTFKAI